MSHPANVGFLLPQFGALAEPERYFVAKDLGYESIWVLRADG